MGRQPFVTFFVSQPFQRDSWKTNHHLFHLNWSLRVHISVLQHIWWGALFLLSRPFSFQFSPIVFQLDLVWNFFSTVMFTLNTMARFHDIVNIFARNRIFGHCTHCGWRLHKIDMSVCTFKRGVLVWCRHFKYNKRNLTCCANCCCCCCCRRFSRCGFFHFFSLLLHYFHQLCYDDVWRQKHIKYGTTNENEYCVVNLHTSTRCHHNSCVPGNMCACVCRNTKIIQNRCV